MRDYVVPEDVQAIKNLVAATGVFSDEEIAVAGELAEEVLLKGAVAGYSFLFLEDEKGALHGYTCYGRIPLTLESYDLYWLAVHPDSQGKGIAASLIAQTVSQIANENGRYLFAETSSSDPYDAARACYTKNGFLECSRIPDFYKPGDARVIFRRILL